MSFDPLCTIDSTPNVGQINAHTFSISQGLLPEEFIPPPAAFQDPDPSTPRVEVAAASEQVEPVESTHSTRTDPTAPYVEVTSTSEQVEPVESTHSTRADQTDLLA